MASISIVSRAAWGAAQPRSRSYVSRATRTAFAVHYDGDQIIRYDAACGEGCRRKIRNTQSFHMGSRGWADIGYNFWICQHGAIFEARGWDVLGAHAGASGNAPAIGVQIHIGGAQQPSAAALAACRALYDMAAERFGRKLAMKGHCDYMSTSCPGKPLLAWVRAGMPARGPSAPTSAPIPGDDDLPYTEKQLNEIVQKAVCDALASQRGHTLAAQAAQRSLSDWSKVPASLAKIQSNLGVVAGVRDNVRDAVKDALKAGGAPDAIADRVLDRLGQALTEGASK